MTMRKKDYEAIARAIGQTTRDYMDHKAIDPQAIMADLTWTIAEYCATQDPTFKRARFLADCGVSQS